MQPISVYLLRNAVDVYTNLSAGWTNERYRRVYNRSIKIFKDVDNRIDIQVRNSDQKKISIETTQTPVFHLIERENQRLLLTKDCSVSDYTLGQCNVTLTSSEILELDPGFYSYNIVLETRSSIDADLYTVTAKKPLYIDSQYGVTADLELFGSVKGEPINSYEISEFSRAITDSLETDYYTSGIIDARPVFNDPQKNHTFQIYFTNYTGELKIQGSLNNGGNPHQWTDISTTNYTSETSSYQNVVGKYNWFRIQHTPVSGTVDKILYR